MRLPMVFSALPAVTGVALTFQADGSWRADFCGISRQRDLVRLTQQGQDLTSAAALGEALAPGPVPLALVLAGRGVLWRALPGPAPESAAARAEPLMAALPGVNLSDFYIQYQPGAGETQVALIRRQLLDALLAELHTAGLWVVAVSLGPYDFATLLPYLPAAAQRPVLAVGDFQVRLSAAGDGLAAVEYQPGEEAVPAAFAVGNDVFSSRQVLPYAAALTALVQPPAAGEERLPVPRVRELRAEWSYRGLYQRLRLAVPLVILVLLLTNFFVAQHLIDERDHLTARLGNNQHLLQQVQQLRQSTAQKHQFLTSTGWAQPSWNSVCADRLAASMAPGLTLLSLDVAPASAGGGAQPQATFQPDLVTVKGQCRDAQQFNAWLQRITKRTWVRAVRDQNFTYDYAAGVGTFTFTLVIKPAVLLS
ncbi:hypothetical protein GCM10028824_43880 [Hymenobacter segetis]